MMNTCFNVEEQKSKSEDSIVVWYTSHLLESKSKQRQKLKFLEGQEQTVMMVSYLKCKELHIVNEAKATQPTAHHQQ
jgi:hypothetical protein